MQTDVKEDFRVIVADPFPEVETFLKKNISDKRFNFFLDPGEGKNEALTMIFQEYHSSNKNDIFILTDGDVLASENAVNEIIKILKRLWLQLSI